MGTPIHVGVVGATGAVGREVLSVLDRVRWRPDQVTVAASPGTTVHAVEYGDETLPVEDVRDLDTGLLDAVILAAPVGPSRDVGERALEDGVVIIDVAGAFRGEPDVPTVVPWINPEALAHGSVRDVVALPGAPALLLASVLGPLARAGLLGHAQATVLVPASAQGRPGIEELSKQVTALFNAGTPPRRIFPHGLAFDLMPALSEPAEDGWTAEETDTVAQVQALLGGAVPLAATLVGVPVFSGISAELVLHPTRQVPVELLTRILGDGGLGLPDQPGVRYLPRPRRVEGQPFAQVGRIRSRDEGRVLHLWLSMDNLRATATAAVGLTGAALRDRIQDASEPSGSGA